MNQTIAFDGYTKAVLTIIAASLAWLCIQGLRVEATVNGNMNNARSSISEKCADKCPRRA